MKPMKALFRSVKLIGFLLLIFFILLPVITSQVITFLTKNYLQEQGFSEVKVSDLWVNPYAAFVKIETIEFLDNGDFYYLRDLEADLSLTALLKKKIEFKKILLAGLKLIIVENESGLITINGITLPLGGEAKNAEKNNTQKTDVWHFAVNQLSVSDLSAKLRLNGLDVDFKLIDFDFNDVSSEGLNTSNLNATLNINRLNLIDQEIETEFDLNINSKINIFLSQNGLSIKTDNDFEFSDIKVNVPEYHLFANDLKIKSQADVKIHEATNYEVSFGLKINDLNVAERVSSQNQEHLLSADKIDISGVKLNSEKAGELTVKILAAEGISVLDQRAEFDAALVDDVSLIMSDLMLILPVEKNEPAVAIDKLEISRAEITLIVDESGGFPQIKTLLSGKESNKQNSIKQQETLPVEESQSTGNFDFRMKDFLVGPNVVFNVEDHSVSPSFYETVKIESLHVQRFGLNSGQRAKVSSSLLLSHDAILTLDGEFSVAQLSVDIASKLKRYQLLQATGYTQKATGYALESGEITIDSNIKLENEIINIKNDILIDQLNLRAVNRDKAVRYANKLAMPLDQALDLLRDGNNQIHLQVPVSGAMNDPDINLDDIINRALGGALKTASISVLKFMLQPYSTVITVAKFASDQVNKLRLDPVTYAPGEAFMGDEARDYAEKIAKILHSKKSLKLKVCGSTNRADEEYIMTLARTSRPDQDEKAGAKIVSKQLNDLAHKRSSGFRSYLIDSLGVSEEKLLICLPIHGVEKDSVPGVELLL